jgi:hypothetical protein
MGKLFKNKLFLLACWQITLSLYRNQYLGLQAVPKPVFPTSLDGLARVDRRTYVTRDSVLNDLPASVERQSTDSSQADEDITGKFPVSTRKESSVG